MRASSRPGFALLLGVALAALSRGYERIGPAPTSWRDTELCSFSPPRPCRDGVLQAGWPLAYLVDTPGISRVGQLALVEDQFRPAAFVADAAIGALVSGLILRGSAPPLRRKTVA
jgi:hypothetical protein